MNRSKIEWCDWSWNPLTGCSLRCSYCYAWSIAKRLRGRFGYPEEDPFEVTFHPERLEEPRRVKKPARIFTCSMGELFDPKSKYKWISKILQEMERNPQHVFQVLTKRPETLNQFRYPSNLWLGVSITNSEQLKGVEYLKEVKYAEYYRYSGAKKIFVSFEPLLEIIVPDLKGIDWVIIGAKTGSKPFTPPQSWVEIITNIAIDEGCAVFHKDNLEYGWLKEYPE